VAKLPEGQDWTYEIKLDGYRAIGAKTKREAIIYSRFNKYPHIAKALTLGVAGS
jgi:ATP-dependent DNA ligase